MSARPSIEEEELLALASRTCELPREKVRQVYETVRDHLCMSLRDEFRVLAEIGGSIISTLDLEEVLSLIVKRAAIAMEARASSLRLLSGDGSTLLMKSSFGFSEQYLEKGPVKVEKSLVDREVLEGTILSIADVTKDPRFQYPHEAQEEGLVSLLCVPLMARGRPLGVMRLYTGEPRTFTFDEITFIAALANHSAIALENAGMYEALQQKLKCACAGSPDTSPRSPKPMNSTHP